MNTSRRPRLLRGAPIISLALVLAMALAACSGGSGEVDEVAQEDDSPAEPSESTTSDSDPTEDPDDGPDYESLLQELYEGTYVEPEGPVVSAPAADRNVWVIPVGMAGAVYVEVAEAASEAAESLGWDVTVFDGEFSPTVQLSGVQQALADGADGIIFYAVDCPAVKNGLDQAREAGVPTVNMAGAECESESFSQTAAYPGYESKFDWIEEYGATQARHAIAVHEGNAKAILIDQTDVEAVRVQTEGSRSALEACDSCEIVGEIEFVSAEFGPELQNKIAQGLLQFPEANTFIVPYGAILAAGGAQALRSSGRSGELFVHVGESDPDTIQMIRDDSGADACLVYVAAMEAYSAINYLVAIFDGQDTSSIHNGVGFQVCDAEHNLPPEGESASAPVDFKSVYERLWGLD